MELGHGTSSGSRLQGLLGSVLGVTSMEEEAACSIPISPEENDSGSDTTELARQLEFLRVHVASVPYECETVDEMNERLNHIIHMIYTTAKSNQIDLLEGWNHVLGFWINTKYPLIKATRIKLLHFYYELCMIPANPRAVAERVRMFSLLLPLKHDLINTVHWHELTLDWRPLWRIIKKELWPMKRLGDPSQKCATHYLHLAEMCKRYFSSKEIRNILKTLLPLITPDTVLGSIPVLLSFLPLSYPQTYIHSLFSIWEAFNSNIVDDRMIEFMSDLAEEHVSGTAGHLGEGGSAWQDVGIWKEDQWAFLMGKCLGSMNLPIAGSKGTGNTAAHADHVGAGNTLIVKKPVNRFLALAKIIVYSISVDGNIRQEPTNGSQSQKESGFLAGSKALNSLEKLITSTETYFHPSNSGVWSISLTSFLQQLSSIFCHRWKEEQDKKCTIPVSQRLTPGIRRAFVQILHPSLIMPHLLERAYGGLEVVNETHRTTAVLSMLSGVALPLVSEKIWNGGQKHLVPLLELSLPGIDLNDPQKTICATMFICSAIQHIRIEDISMHFRASGALTADSGPWENMDIVNSEHLPDGTEGIFPVLSREEELALSKDSTAGFADWLATLFRRVIALYENLPEEGGRRNTTGGKSEETVLKSIKSMLDIVCLHLSDSLFDLVLKIVYEYATTNTKSNAVRAVGQLVACLARANPQKTTDKFLPFCVEQIKEELKHGASSIRTTSSHAALPSDTTLHWNISILRGCLGYGGETLLKHKDSIIELLILLVDKTKSERGYSGTGRLITRLLNTISAAYPINSRFVNSDEWNDEEFGSNHILHWGKFYLGKDVKIEWHVPSAEEIDFVVELLDRLVSPFLEKIEGLLENSSNWDNISRNDFCRYLYAVRSYWGGLSTFIQEYDDVKDPLAEDETGKAAGLEPYGLALKAGFTLTDPNDPNYRHIYEQKQRYGNVMHRAATVLQGNNGGEDHIDAVVALLKAIDIYMLEYGVSYGTYIHARKSYAISRDVMRLWPRQRVNTRLVFLKRAQVYHSARLASHTINRRPKELNVKLIEDLIELSLSPYTRIRKTSQGLLYSCCETYPLSTEFVMKKMVPELGKGTDPDRMKGALFVLSSKTLRKTLLISKELQSSFITMILQCQHQEKPSVQKLVTSVYHDFLVSRGSDDHLQKIPVSDEASTLNSAMQAIRDVSPFRDNDAALLNASLASYTQIQEQNKHIDENLMKKIVEIARRPETHWRYLQMSIQIIISLLRRDTPISAEVAKLVIEATTKSHPTTRIIAQRAFYLITSHIKVRSYSKSETELWFEEWRNPLQQDLPVTSPQEITEQLQSWTTDRDMLPDVFVDKITSGFLLWQPSIKAYRLLTDTQSLTLVWEERSKPALLALESVLQDPSYFQTLFSLWAQESNTRGLMNTTLELRQDNMWFMKSIVKTFEKKVLTPILTSIEPLIFDSNRFSQRAAAETIVGLFRGSKHWSGSDRKVLWSWFMKHVEGIYSQMMKPDTVAFWESVFELILNDRDPRRCRPLIDWITSLPLDFHSDSAFSMNKSLGLSSGLPSSIGIRYGKLCKQHMSALFDNADTGYAEIRGSLAEAIHILMICDWYPSFPSLDAFLTSCKEEKDPLGIRKPRYIEHVNSLLSKFSIWRTERLPPPRVTHSQYDKVSLMLLNWLWTLSFNLEASLAFPYVIPLLPDVIKMTELNDNPELSAFSSGLLLLLSSTTPPREYIGLILDEMITSVRSTSSRKIKITVLPILTIFYYRNILEISEELSSQLLEVVISCLADENVEVRSIAAKLLSGLLRCSQRRNILPLRDRFVSAVGTTKLPKRQDPGYAQALRNLHAAILGVCALIESFPYSIESWMPPLTEVLAPHVSDPPPISDTIRKCASEFKKTHQDTWHIDQQAFDEDQLQALSNMLIGTSYYA
ncbi:ARM repeat-containing [Pyrrhoderma noxium]|uniref:ARM repeat-containing n=1 Tax=Pyrrhoderma noxium TaxID=2282107 RepID=A0A286UQL3_9AGAM|nr:ARM repeat-containing [Pyrrhoderma noxium]